MPTGSLGQWPKKIAYQFFKFGLKDHISRFLEPMSLRLLRRGKKFEMDASDFIRGDIPTADAVNAGMGGGQGGKHVLSDEELRRMMGASGDKDPEDTFSESSPGGQPAVPGRNNGTRRSRSNDPNAELSLSDLRAIERSHAGREE